MRRVNSHSDSQRIHTIRFVRRCRRGSDPLVLLFVFNTLGNAGVPSLILSTIANFVHRAGASISQLSDVSGLGRKTVTAIVSSEARLHD